MSDAKSDFWSLTCGCGAHFQMTSEKILSAKTIQCPNCGLTPDTQNLKKAAESMLTFQSSIMRIQRHGSQSWQIIPPKVDHLTD